MPPLEPVVQLVGWVAGAWLLARVPRCRQPDDGAPVPESVGVVIPARNEARMLPRLLASLTGQQPGPARVVVVDDGSHDATAEVAREGGATVVPVGPLPEGWTGKCRACWVGAGAVAECDVVVFLDADTTLAPGGLAAILAEHRRRGGLVSVQPFHVTERFYERLSAFFNVVAMMGVDAFNPLRGRIEPRGAFGPCLVASHDDYMAAGGHEAVRAAVVEDVALARRFLSSGRPVTCFGGRGTISFRMYPDGPAQLVEGWTKNFAQGAAGTRPVTLALVVAWVSACILAALGLVGSVLDLAAGALDRAGTVVGPAASVLGLGTSAEGAGGGGEWAAFAVYLAFVAQLAWMLRRIGRWGWWPAVVFPLPLAVFVVVFTRSVVLTYVRGEVRWRGRSISTRRRL